MTTTDDQAVPTTDSLTNVAESPLASVIIPVWNGIGFLEKCLSSLQAQSYPSYEVIAVDNASTDGSADFVAKHFPGVRLIRNAHNLGFAGGCNVGLRAAQGEMLVLLNQDTEVEQDWLLHVVAALRVPSVGVVGCKIMYPDGATIQHAGGWFEWPLALAHHYGQGEPASGQYEVPRRLEFVTGAALGVRREVVEQVGMLDEAFWPGYFEDADFCFRVREAGYDIWYRPEACLRHVESTTIPDPLQRSRFYQRGRLRFLLKHLEPDQWLRDWVPAEEAYQPPAIFGLESRSLRLGYLEAIPEAVSILYERWNADAQRIHEVCAALQHLHRVAWKTDLKRFELRDPLPSLPAQNEPAWMPLPGNASAVSRIVQALPKPLEPSNPVELPLSQGAQPTTSFHEYEFQPHAPLVGPLFAKVRSLWHDVSARWAIRDLIRQIERFAHQQAVVNLRQELVNQRSERIREWQEALNLRQYAFNEWQAIINQWVEAALLRQEAINNHQAGFNHQQMRTNDHQRGFNDQQMQINQQLDRHQNRIIHELGQRLMDVASENELLAREIANLRMELEAMQEGAGK